MSIPKNPRERWWTIHCVETPCASPCLCRSARGLPACLVASWPGRQAALLPRGLQAGCKARPARHRPDSGRASAPGGLDTGTLEAIVIERLRLEILFNALYN